MAIENDEFITKEDISKLLQIMDDKISMHDLSTWLKSKTDDEWVVVPRGFCSIVVEFFEWHLKEDSDQNFLSTKEMFERNIVAIKKYL